MIAGITVLPARSIRRRAGRRRDVAAPADARDGAALDQERGVLDRRAAVAGNDARAFEQRSARAQAARRTRREDEEGERRDDVAEHGRSVRLRLDWHGSSKCALGCGVVKAGRPNRCTR